MSLGEAALKGALSGLIGGTAMAMTMKVEQQLLLPEGARREAPPVALVETEADKRDVHLSASQASLVGMGAHLAYSALTGAVFGVLQTRLKGPPLLDGLVFAGLLYAAGYTKWGIMPRTGTLPPPTHQPIDQAAIPAGAHTVFGLTTAAAFGALR